MNYTKHEVKKLGVNIQKLSHQSNYYIFNRNILENHDLLVYNHGTHFTIRNMSLGLLLKLVIISNEMLLDKTG